MLPRQEAAGAAQRGAASEPQRRGAAGKVREDVGDESQDLVKQQFSAQSESRGTRRANLHDGSDDRTELGVELKIAIELSL